MSLVMKYLCFKYLQISPQFIIYRLLKCLGKPIILRSCNQEGSKYSIECKRAVKWICDYISYQCSRPPPAHSKDLHSTIVAAFQCTSVWLMEHPYLLYDKDCLNIVFEVVELGISGSKSIGKSTEIFKYKEDKELKPVSMRVRDAAEILLTIILEKVGYFPDECGAQSTSSLLDETSLYKQCHLNPYGAIKLDQAVQKFRYFVAENMTILALLEDPLGNDQDPQPTVTFLIRGPFGRHAWTMQLRHLPRSRSGTTYHAANPGRPVAMNEMPLRHEMEQQLFPDGCDRVTPCIADFSIPAWNELIQKIGNENTEKLLKLLELQMAFEKLAWAETNNSLDNLSHIQEAEPPPTCNDFQASRLLLSHFGFLSIVENRDERDGINHFNTSALSLLDAERSGFLTDLQSLDRLSSRTHDTLHIFYVKVGQSNAGDIIGNMSDEGRSLLDPNFWDLLLSLGTVVNVEEHYGWTGSLNSSWLIKTSNLDTGDIRTNSPSHNLKLNGDKYILYWADISSEIAFVVPTEWNKIIEEGVRDVSEENDYFSSHSFSMSTTNEKLVGYYERGISESIQAELHKGSVGEKVHGSSIEFSKNKLNPSFSGNSAIPNSADVITQGRRRTGATKPQLLGQAPLKLLLVWLESFEDNLTLPVDDLLCYTHTGEEFQTGIMPRSSDCYIIYLHALNSGLLRVKLHSPSGRLNFAIPLVDGMIVNHRIIGNLVRQTAYNMFKRRRFDNDIYQPPHVRRRLKVQDMVQKYKLELNKSEFLGYTFQNL